MSTVLLSHTLYEENGKLLVSSWYKNNSIIEEDGDGNYYHPTWEEIIPFTEWSMKARYFDWEDLENKTKLDLSAQISFNIKSLKEISSYSLIYEVKDHKWYGHYRRYGKYLYAIFRLFSKYPATLSLRVIDAIVDIYRHIYWKWDLGKKVQKIKDRLKRIPLMVKVFPSLNINEYDLPS